MNLSKRNKRLFFTVFLFVIFLALGITPAQQIIPEDLQKILFLPSITPSTNVAGTKVSISPIEIYKVIKVIDGDTIHLENGQKVRYIGIDSPESKNPQGDIECYAAESAKRNTELVLGKIVKLIKDISETDRYGRLLRYVYVDSTLINEQLVKEGYALASPYPPDINYQEILDNAEQHAKENKKGLWNSCINL